MFFCKQDMFSFQIKFPDFQGYTPKNTPEARGQQV